MAEILPAGTPAPDFTLHVTPDQELSLSELKGRRVIVAGRTWAFFAAARDNACAN